MISTMNYTQENSIHQINLPFFRKLAEIVEGMFEDKRQVYKTVYAECQTLKDELKELEEQLLQEKSILDAIDTYKPHSELSSQKYLKKIWKDACKLCHPDVVKHEYKAVASQTMQTLNSYYSDGNIVAVEEILRNLKRGYYEKLI